MSNLRFMPKPSSLRAITNLSSVATQFPAVNQMGPRESKPVNTQLFDLFSVLKFEKVSAAICLIFGQLFVIMHKQSRREDSTSCMGYRDIHSRRLRTFSLKLPSQAEQRYVCVLSVLVTSSMCPQWCGGYSTRFWCVFVHLSSLSLFYQPPHFVRGQLVHTQITGGYHFRALITALY